jgi:hypothetical protein
MRGSTRRKIKTKLAQAATAFRCLPLGRFHRESGPAFGFNYGIAGSLAHLPWGSPNGALRWETVCKTGPSGCLFGEVPEPVPQHEQSYSLSPSGKMLQSLSLAGVHLCLVARTIPANSSHGSMHLSVWTLQPLRWILYHRVHGSMYGFAERSEMLPGDFDDPNIPIQNWWQSEANLKSWLITSGDEVTL